MEDDDSPPGGRVEGVVWLRQCQSSLQHGHGDVTAVVANDVVHCTVGVLEGGEGGFEVKGIACGTGAAVSLDDVAEVDDKVSVGLVECADCGLELWNGFTPCATAANSCRFAVYGDGFDASCCREVRVLDVRDCPELEGDVMGMSARFGWHLTGDGGIVGGENVFEPIDIIWNQYKFPLSRRSFPRVCARIAVFLVSEEGGGHRRGGEEQDLRCGCHRDTALAFK